MHQLDFFDTLRVSIKLLETFLDENADNLRVFLNGVLKSLGEGVFEASEERVDATLKCYEVHSDAVDLLLVWKFLQLTTLLL